MAARDEWLSGCSVFSGNALPAFDPMDFLARLLMPVPQPKLHTVRYYGEYSSVARAGRRTEKAKAEGEVSVAPTVLRSSRPEEA